MDVNKFFYYSALFSLLNAMNDYVACIRPLRGRVRLVTTWGCSRVVTPMPFMDQMLDRLSETGWYYFLDGYSGYNQISIAPENQEKTTFTCHYGTFAFKRMPFRLM